MRRARLITASNGSASPAASAASIHARKPTPVVATTTSGGLAISARVSAISFASSRCDTVDSAGAKRTVAPRRSRAVASSRLRRSAVISITHPASGCPNWLTSHLPLSTVWRWRRSQGTREQTRTSHLSDDDNRGRFHFCFSGNSYNVPERATRDSFVNGGAVFDDGNRGGVRAARVAPRLHDVRKRAHAHQDHHGGAGTHGCYRCGIRSGVPGGDQQR